MYELAESAGIKLPSSLDKKVLNLINPIRKFGDDVALQTLKAVAENGTTQNEAEVLIASISKAKSLETKMAAINDFVNQDSTKQRRPITRRDGKSIVITRILMIMYRRKEVIRIAPGTYVVNVLRK